MTGPLSLAIREPPFVDGRGSAPGRLFGWILALGGAALMLFGADEFRRVTATRAWPTASGRVDSAAITSDTVATSVGKYRNTPIVKPRFHVTYRYQVDGAEYIGRRVDVLPPDRRDANADLRRYSAGMAVAVRYNPERAAEAVLDAGQPTRSVVITSLGVAMLVMWRRLTGRTTRRSVRSLTPSAAATSGAEPLP